MKIIGERALGVPNPVTLPPSDALGCFAYRRQISKSPKNSGACAALSADLHACFSIQGEA